MRRDPVHLPAGNAPTDAANDERIGLARPDHLTDRV